MHGDAETYFLWEKVSSTEESPKRLTQTEPLGLGGGTESGGLLFSRSLEGNHLGSQWSDQYDLFVCNKSKNFFWFLI